MLCERAQELFSEYHEGAIKAAMQVPLESHLEECVNCRTSLAGLREVWTMLDGAPVVEPPANFRAVVWARIDALEAEKARNRKPLFAIQWSSLFRPANLGWAAAALAILMLAPVVIPGPHSVARMWFPWNLFYSAPASKVTIGMPLVTIDEGRKWVDVQVTNNGTSAARIEVKVDGTAASPVVIEAPAGSSSRYHVAPAEGATRVQATWREDGSSRSQELPVAQ
jgi:hypothetical protein